MIWWCRWIHGYQTKSFSFCLSSRTTTNRAGITHELLGVHVVGTATETQPTPTANRPDCTHTQLIKMCACSLPAEPLSPVALLRHCKDVQLHPSPLCAWMEGVSVCSFHRREGNKSRSFKTTWSLHRASSGFDSSQPAFFGFCQFNNTPWPPNPHPCFMLLLLLMTTSP